MLYAYTQRPLMYSKSGEEHCPSATHRKIYSWEVQSYPRIRIHGSSDCIVVMNWTKGLHTRWTHFKCLNVFLYLPRRPPKKSFLLIRCWAKTFLDRKILIWFNSESNRTDFVCVCVCVCVQDKVVRQYSDLDVGIRHVRKDGAISSVFKLVLPWE